MNRLITCLLIILISQHSHGQVLQNTSEECFDLSKKDTEYFIQINGENYVDKEKIFICKNDLPLDIKIIYNDDRHPFHLDTVQGIAWDWSNCNCDDVSGQGPINSIDSSSFSSKFTMKVKFRENYLPGSFGDGITLQLIIHEITNQLKIDVNSTHSKSNFGYDDHPSENYPHYHPTIDAKFILDGQNDSIYFHNRKHKNMTRTINFEDNSPGILDYSIDDEGIELFHTGNYGFDSCYVKTCGYDSLLLVDIYLPSTLDVNLYILQESNDDYANYCVDYMGNGEPYDQIGDVRGDLLADCVTPIDSLPNPSEFECINPGMDGTLDLYNEISFGYWKDRKDNDINKPSDSLNPNFNKRHLLKINPSVDNQGAYFCNSRPVILESNWNADLNGDGTLDAYVDAAAMQVDINKIQSDLNEIYNKAGIYVNVEYKGVYYRNYNSNSFVANDKTEQNDFHISFFGGGRNAMINSDTTSIFLLDSLYNSELLEITDKLAGRATGDNGGVYNSVFIHFDEFHPRTISHEIGHAKFELYHPDVGEGSETGWILDDLESPEVDDYFNFMNSGFLYNEKTTHDISKYRLRKYQWKFIRDGK
jgi:hypothetical protein